MPTCFAHPAVLKIELINQWYPMLVDKLELLSSIAHDRAVGSRTVFLSTMQRVLSRGCTATPFRVLGGTFPEPFAVNKQAMSALRRRVHSSQSIENRGRGPARLWIRAHVLYTRQNASLRDTEKATLPY